VYGFWERGELIRGRPKQFTNTRRKRSGEEGKKMGRYDTVQRKAVANLPGRHE